MSASVEYVLDERVGDGSVVTCMQSTGWSTGTSVKRTLIARDSVLKEK